MSKPAGGATMEPTTTLKGDRDCQIPGQAHAEPHSHQGEGDLQECAGAFAGRRDHRGRVQDRARPGGLYLAPHLSGG